MVRARPKGRSAFVGLAVPGLYVALLERERASFERNRVDPRWRFTERGRRGEPPPEQWLTPRSALLDALEAGEVVKLRAETFVAVRYRRCHFGAIRRSTCSL